MTEENGVLWQIVKLDWLGGFEFKYRLAKGKPITIDLEGDEEFRPALGDVTIDIRAPNKPHRGYEFSVELDEDGEIEEIFYDEEDMVPENPLVEAALVSIATRHMAGKPYKLDCIDVSRMADYYDNSDAANYAVLAYALHELGHVWMEDPLAEEAEEVARSAGEDKFEDVYNCLSQIKCTFGVDYARVVIKEIKPEDIAKAFQPTDGIFSIKNALDGIAAK